MLPGRSRRGDPAGEILPGRSCRGDPAGRPSPSSCFLCQPGLIAESDLGASTLPPWLPPCAATADHTAGSRRWRAGVTPTSAGASSAHIGRIDRPAEACPQPPRARRGRALSTAARLPTGPGPPGHLVGAPSRAGVYPAGGLRTQDLCTAPIAKGGSSLRDAVPAGSKRPTSRAQRCFGAQLPAVRWAVPARSRQGMQEAAGTEVWSTPVASLPTDASFPELGGQPMAAGRPRLGVGTRVSGMASGPENSAPTPATGLHEPADRGE